MVAHFPTSGGIFAGGEVTYRGVRIGQVEQARADRRRRRRPPRRSTTTTTRSPTDTLALVGNRSAVGEQYVELQPQVDDESPYLEDDSEIADENTRTPIATEKLLDRHLQHRVESVDQEALQTTVDELGQAFAGTGEDLQRIIDTGNSFIETANDNFDVTTALIRDSNTVLQTQVDSASAIRDFASAAQRCSAAPSPAPTATCARSSTPARSTANRAAHLPRGERGRPRRADQQPGHHRRGRRQAPRRHRADPGIYPYVVEGGFTVVSKSPDTGLYDAHFGLILTEQRRSATRATRAPTPAPAAGRQQRAR